MKKMNFFIRSVSYFSLLFLIMFGLNTNMSGQIAKKDAPKLNSTELVFKSNNEAISSLQAKINDISSRLVKLEGQSKQSALDLISMYNAIISRVQSGSSVQNSAVMVWDQYKPKFSGKLADQVEIKLINVIAKQ